MSNNLKSFLLLKRIRKLFDDEGIKKELLEDNYAYDAILDYMDEVWKELTSEERKKSNEI